MASFSWSNLMNTEGGAPIPRRKPSESGSHIEALERKVTMLALISQAMWEIMREKGGVPEDILAAKVEEIDLRDGLCDGRLARGAVKCPACGKSINHRHQQCPYCGRRLPEKEVFDRL
jgi:hypothetical protein